MFGVPVWLAYRFAAWLQPIADSSVVEPVKAALAPHLSPLIAAVLTGSYGLLTLGWYSFLWAFPVVLLIGISVALCEETGLNDRMTRALDPPLRLFGLAGRDLLPVLTGYGCNVVAVFQSRTCSRCSRGNCVSMIAFGSACSYQIGASLSLFGSSRHPGLFIPYLVALFVVGAVHTRLWNGRRLTDSPATETVHTFLQRPSVRAVWWRIRAVVKQFLLQAMPMFLAICAAAALMAYFGLTDGLSRLAAPVMGLFRLPADAAPGIVFSVLRKDGLLTLNQDQGAWLQARTAGEVFVLVWLASTLTACLVTLWTVRREFGWRFAFSLAGKQAITSLVTALIAAWAIV
jgi:Fe2+ transport system protein B